MSSFKVDLTNYLRDTFNFSGFASFGPFGFYGSDGGGAEHSEDYKTGAVTTGAAVTTKLYYEMGLWVMVCPYLAFMDLLVFLEKALSIPYQIINFTFIFKTFMPWIVVAKRISLIH